MIIFLLLLSIDIYDISIIFFGINIFYFNHIVITFLRKHVILVNIIFKFCIYD